MCASPFPVALARRRGRQTSRGFRSPAAVCGAYLRVHHQTSDFLPLALLSREGFNSSIAACAVVHLRLRSVVPPAPVAPASVAPGARGGSFRFSGSWSLGLGLAGHVVSESTAPAPPARGSVPVPAFPPARPYCYCLCGPERRRRGRALLLVATGGHPKERALITRVGASGEHCGGHEAAHLPPNETVTGHVDAYGPDGSGALTAGRQRHLGGGRVQEGCDRVLTFGQAPAEGGVVQGGADQRCQLCVDLCCRRFVPASLARATLPARQDIDVPAPRRAEGGVERPRHQLSGAQPQHTGSSGVDGRPQGLRVDGLPRIESQQLPGGRHTRIRSARVGQDYVMTTGKERLNCDLEDAQHRRLRRLPLPREAATRRAVVGDGQRPRLPFPVPVSTCYRWGVRQAGRQRKGGVAGQRQT
eukprot:scaffold820_cov104-Isochrysis_galbana.AAC.8